MNEQNKEISKGILMPAFQHRFRIRVLLNESDIFTTQITSCIVDLLNKTISMSVVQPAIDAGLLDIIEYICSHYFSLQIDHMTGNGEAEFTNMYTGCKVISHKLNYSYTLDDKVMHEIVAAYNGTIRD